MIQAQWYNKKFECSSSVSNLIDNLSASYEIKEKSIKTKSGKSKTVKGGVKAGDFSFTITPLCMTGANPTDEFFSFKKLIGKTARLYIGGKGFGPYLMLKSVSFSNPNMTGAGDILSAEISLTFEPSTKKKAVTDARKITASQDAKKSKKANNIKAKGATAKSFAVGSKVKIVGNNYADGTAVKKSDKSKKLKIDNINDNIALLSNGKKIKLDMLSLC